MLHWVVTSKGEPIRHFESNTFLEYFWKQRQATDPRRQIEIKHLGISLGLRK